MDAADRDGTQPADRRQLRQRYHTLVLHDPVWYDHMPYLPFPEHWPVFTPNDKLAGWFEAYASAMELNVWTGTDLRGR